MKYLRLLSLICFCFILIRTESIQESSDQDDRVQVDQEAPVVLEDVRDELIKLFDEDNTFPAFKIIRNLERAIDEKRVVIRDRSEGGKSDDVIIREVLNNPKIKRLITNKNVFDYRYPQMFSDQDWNNKYVDEGDKKMYTMKDKKFPGMPTQFYDAIIDTNYINVVMLLMCADTMQHWLPINKLTRIEQRLSPNRVLMYQRFHPPIFLADREAYLEGASFVYPDDEALVFILDTVKEEYFGNKLVKEEGLSEMFYGNSMGYIKPLSENKTQLKFIIHANLRLDFIPEGLIDFGIKLVSLPFLNFICDMASKLPPFYKEPLLKDRDYYLEIAKTLTPLEKYGKLDFDEFMLKTFPEKKQDKKSKYNAAKKGNAVGDENNNTEL